MAMVLAPARKALAGIVRRTGVWRRAVVGALEAYVSLVMVPVGMLERPTSMPLM